MFGIDGDILLVYGLILLAVVLFANKNIPFDLASVILMAVLVVSGILTPKEGLSGLSNPATVTIACMFVLSAALQNTGALNIVGDYFLKLGEMHTFMALIVIMASIGIISAFINNTAAVAIFIPVIISLSRNLNESASRLLMPLSFAAMFGGVCTLIGTSTNLLVNSIAIDNGLSGFGMFEFTPMGLIFFIAGFIYLFTVGIKLIPERRKDEGLAASFKIQDYITDVVLEEDSQYAGTPLKDTELLNDRDLEIVEVFDSDNVCKTNRDTIQLEANDTLRIRGSAEEINKLLESEEVRFKTQDRLVDGDFEQGETKLIEAVIAPESSIEGKKLGDVDFYKEYGAIVLAIRQQGEIQRDDLENLRLQRGTSLLLFCEENRIPEIQRAREFVLATTLDLPEYERSKIPVAVGIILGVVLLAAFGILPIVESAICGVILMVLTGCITTEAAYRSINWKVILLLGGVLPLGIAMRKTGAAELMVDAIITHFESLGPTAIVSAFFFLSMMLTNIISNQATAALLAPIAIEAASSANINAEPLLIAVTMAASLSFMTPIGYQTNTMIFGPGQYRFSDYMKVGTPLNILFWILGTLFIPLFWPF